MEKDKANGMKMYGTKEFPMTNTTFISLQNEIQALKKKLNNFEQDAELLRLDRERKAAELEELIQKKNISDLSLRACYTAAGFILL